MKLLKYLTILSVIFLASCSTKHWWKPRGELLFSMMPEGGTPGFELGWKHGCESGAGTQFGGGIYKTFYTWRRDPDITSTKPDIEKIREKYGDNELKDINWSDPDEVKKNFADYNIVFWDAHFVCRQVVIGTLQMAKMDPPLPGAVRYDPTAHHVGSVWRLNGKGDARIGSTGYW